MSKLILKDNVITIYHKEIEQYKLSISEDILGFKLIDLNNNRVYRDSNRKGTEYIALLGKNIIDLLKNKEVNEYKIIYSWQNTGLYKVSFY